MPELELSRSGHPILIHEGRRLGSKYDPTREAQMRLDSMTVWLAKLNKAYFLGVESGYLVTLFTKRYPSHTAFVFEPHSDIFQRAMRLQNQVQWVEASSADLGNTSGKIVWVRSPSDLNQFERISGGIIFPCPGPQVDPFLNRAYRILRGPNVIERARPSNDRPRTLEDRIWACLRELVK